MSKPTFRLGSMTLDAAGLGVQGNAVLGIRGSGKTYTATWLAEHFFDVNIPFTTLDPTGVWPNMQMPGRGRGYPIVVASPEGGDLPLTVSSAKEIVRAAMAGGVSLVLNLKSPRLSKADWRRIVTDALSVMLHENDGHGMRHVFIEEAAEFAPQVVRSDQGHVYAEVEKLARMGGNAGLGYTLVNQRAEDVNKSVLELCDNLFLHRQKGKNSLRSLRQWFDYGGLENTDEVMASVPGLSAGECWVWLQQAPRAAFVKVPDKNSFHPDRRMMRGDVTAQKRKRVDVGKFVASMRENLGKIEQEIAANDPAELRKRIAELERQLSAKRAAQDDEQIHAAEEKGRLLGQQIARRQVEELKNGNATALALAEKLSQAIDSQSRLLASLLSKQAMSLLAAPKAQTHGGNGTSPPPAPARQTTGPSDRGDAGLGAGERAMLAVLAQYSRAIPRETLSVCTGYKKSTRNTYLQRLGQAGYIDQSGDKVFITAAGARALGDHPAQPTDPSSLRDFWLERLPKGEAEILRVLLQRGADGVLRDEISEQTGFSKSTRNTYLQRMSARLIIRSVGERVAPVEELL